MPKTQGIKEKKAARGIEAKKAPTKPIHPVKFKPVTDAIMRKYLSGKQISVAPGQSVKLAFSKFMADSYAAEIAAWPPTFKSKKGTALFKGLDPAAKKEMKKGLELFKGMKLSSKKDLKQLKGLHAAELARFAAGG